MDILRSALSLGVTPRISCLGFMLDTYRVVAPDTDGVMIHFAFRFAAASTEEYPIAVETLDLRWSPAWASKMS